MFTIPFHALSKRNCGKIDTNQYKVFRIDIGLYQHLRGDALRWKIIPIVCHFLPVCISLWHLSVSATHIQFSCLAIFHFPVMTHYSYLCHEYAQTVMILQSVPFTCQSGRTFIHHFLHLSVCLYVHLSHSLRYHIIARMCDCIFVVCGQSSNTKMIYCCIMTSGRPS